jgi:hypothetical protein
MHSAHGGAWDCNHNFDDLMTSNPKTFPPAVLQARRKSSSRRRARFLD